MEAKTKACITLALVGDTETTFRYIYRNKYIYIYTHVYILEGALNNYTLLYGALITVYIALLNGPSSGAWFPQRIPGSKANFPHMFGSVKGWFSNKNSGVVKSVSPQMSGLFIGWFMSVILPVIRPPHAATRPFLVTLSFPKLSQISLKASVKMTDCI